MNEKNYEKWKKHRSQINVSAEFSENVMKRVHEYEQKKFRLESILNPLVKVIDENPLAKLALILAGGALGFVRVAFIMFMFLRPC